MRHDYSKVSKEAWSLRNNYGSWYVLGLNKQGTQQPI